MLFPRGDAWSDASEPRAPRTTPRDDDIGMDIGTMGCGMMLCGMMTSCEALVLGREKMAASPLEEPRGDLGGGSCCLIIPAPPQLACCC